MITASSLSVSLRTSRMFDVSLLRTLAPLGPTLSWVLNVSHRVVGQWPTYRRNRRAGTAGRTGRVTYSAEYVVVDVGRTYQLRRRRPMPCRVECGRRRAGPPLLVKRLEGGGREDEWGDNGARLHSHPSSGKTSRQLPHVKLCGFQRGTREDFENLFPSSPSHLSLFHEVFSLSEGHTHTPESMEV